MRLAQSLFVCTLACAPLFAQQQNDQTTPNLGFIMPEFNAPNWDTPLNGDWLMLDQYLSGGKAIPSLTVTGTLSAGAITGLSSSTITSALGYTPLNPANNLNDVPNKATALLNLGAQPAGSYITSLSGDVSATGPGGANATLATVNSNPGSCGDATHSCQINTDTKGRILSATPISITGGGGGGSGAEFYSQSFTNATTVSIAHNLNSLNVIPAVFDSTGKVIGYQDFTLTDANDATLTFSQPTSGTVRIMTATSGVFAQNFTNATSVSLAHNLGTTQLFATVYNTSNVSIGYQDLTPTDSNNATLTFGSPVSGRVVIINP